MYQGDQDTRAAGANGVAEGNGATVYVHARPIPVEFPAVGQGLGGKGFVDLDQVEIANLHACALKQALNSTRGGCEDIAWGDGCRSVAGDTRHDCQAVGAGKVLVDYNRGRGAIAQAGSIGSGSPLVTLLRVLVLLVTGDTELFSDDLGLFTHMYILKGAPETIMPDCIDYFSIAHPVARASLQQQVGGIAHALHAARYKGLVIASTDRLGGKHNGFQAGATDVVDGKGG